MEVQKFSIKVQANDIVVLGSDGLFDNVFPEESAAITALIHRRGDPPQVAAAGLAQFASLRLFSLFMLKRISFSLSLSFAFPDMANAWLVVKGYGRKV